MVYKPVPQNGFKLLQDQFSYEVHANAFKQIYLETNIIKLRKFSVPLIT